MHHAAPTPLPALEGRVPVPPGALDRPLHRLEPVHGMKTTPPPCSGRDGGNNKAIT